MLQKIVRALLDCGGRQYIVSNYMKAPLALLVTVITGFTSNVDAQTVKDWSKESCQELFGQEWIYENTPHRLAEKIGDKGMAALQACKDNLSPSEKVQRKRDQAEAKEKTALLIEKRKKMTPAQLSAQCYAASDDRLKVQSDRLFSRNFDKQPMIYQQAITKQWNEFVRSEKILLHMCLRSISREGVNK
ncbi:hypothetical protein [Aeromonas veronii]|uniref:hypothetical protein n=1 Tax=Aeromonas veronii TaxID=654 RepID=UPI0007BC68DE|nr:hypothetical protein [Aeromonas veronii]KZW96754.1 hypothetical protein WM54_07360 [Aeromonas veronii]